MPDAHPTAAGEKIDAHTGTYAEYVCVPAWKVAKIPTTTTLEKAAAVPLAGLTAYQVVVDHLKASAGMRLGGKVVSAVDFAISEMMAAANCAGNAFTVQPSAEQLAILAKLIDDDAIKRLFLHSPMLPRHMTLVRVNAPLGKFC
jgi:NADPH:quinone reductase-like Zn-dependent oxidoreductase